jgi:hypothetical protein
MNQALSSSGTLGQFLRNDLLFVYPEIRNRRSRSKIEGRLALCLSILQLEISRQKCRIVPTWADAPQTGPQAESFDLPHASILELPSKSISTIQKPNDDSYLEAKCYYGQVSLLCKTR